MAKHSSSKSLTLNNTEKSPSLKAVEPYPVISTFMFTDYELANTPSRRIHNINLEEEMILRRSGTSYIQELAEKVTRTNNKEYQEKLSF